MAKDFKKGLKNLVGEKPEETPEQTGAATSEAPESVEEKAPIDTIKDEALKAKLLARQTKDRGRRKKGEEFVSSTIGWDRVCLLMKDDTYRKVKLISLKDSLQIKETVEALLSVAIKKYEDKFGELNPVEFEAPEDNLSKFNEL